jgi:hypothetical protein
MARRWFSRKSLTAESEKLYLLTNTNADATLNGHRLLTDLDIPQIYMEDIVLAVPGPSLDLTNTGVPLQFSAVSIPSQDGFTQLNSTTFQSTKKGIYMFQIQLIMANTSRVSVTLYVDGVVTDSQLSVLDQTVGGQLISHNFLFVSARQTDGTRTYSFTGFGEDLPTPGATSHCNKCECNINHFNHS